jgi:hypothetical protein
MNYLKDFFYIIMVVLLTAMVLAIPLQFLWNYCLVPAIDGINTISSLQAIGLNFLASILFKNSSPKKDSK